MRRVLTSVDMRLNFVNLFALVTLDSVVAVELFDLLVRVDRHDKGPNVTDWISTTTSQYT